ncbi:lipopolysaccharide biosynthesis protein [Imbroritus primus]|uniref:Lipopolysaccharide biosynthesis protein n=1 Tax=Imbroritus primus TaxID=3058603 RepID=A0ACD3SS69_9BURK|nr:lipopolysaccharide biosynthesis protein [Burkholderiaceae bacterium PBA]
MQRRLTHNVLWVLAERGVQTVAGIGIAAMLARALGVEGFGLFQYAQSLVLIAAAATLVCGAEVIVPRLVALPAPDTHPRLLRHVFALRLMAAALAYVGLLAAVFWLSESSLLRATVAILGLSILLREPFGTVIAWLQAMTDNRPASVIAMAALLVKLLLIGTLYGLGVRALPAYAGVLALESLLVAACLAMLYARRTRGMPPHAGPLDRGILKTLLHDGVLFWLAMLVMMAARRVDQLLLKPAVPLAELGAYAASMQLLDNLLLLATVMVNALAPLLVYAQVDRAMAMRRVAQLASGMALLGLAGGAVLALLAPWVVHLLYGAAFSDAAALLRLVALGSALLFADAALTLLAVMLRRPIWIVGKWLAVLAVTIAIDSMLIPSMGARGAAIGYLCANACAVLIGVTLLVRAWCEEKPA